MSLSRINTGLFVAIIAINGYILLAPLLPQLLFWYDTKLGNRALDLTNEVKLRQSSSNFVNRQSKTLIVPSMLLRQPILEGSRADRYKTLDKGVWHLPASSTPDRGGNTVLIGHRFTYTNPTGVFYNLDKISPGDIIGLYWEGKKYTYRVSDIKVVEPYETSVEDNTKDARLTLYTCTPLWLPKDRLVIVARLQEAS